MKNKLFPVTIILSIALLLSLLTTGTTVYLHFFNKPQETVAPVEYTKDNIKCIIRNIKSFYDEYSENAITAHNKYQNTNAEFTGKIAAISKDEGGFYVRLIPKNESTTSNASSIQAITDAMSNMSAYIGVKCYFDDQDTKELETYKTGDEIILVGKITDYENIVIAEHCKVLQETLFPKTEEAATE